MEPFVADTIRMFENIGENMHGIGLRDLFAMNAMNAIIGDHTVGNLEDIINDFAHKRTIPQKEGFGHDKESEESLTPRDWIARASYLMADAMMAARKKKN